MFSSYQSGRYYGFADLEGGNTPTEKLMDTAGQIAAHAPRGVVKKMWRGVRGAAVNPCVDGGEAGVVCAVQEDDSILASSPSSPGDSYSPRTALFAAELVSRLELALQEGKRQPRLTDNLVQVALIGTRASPNLVWVVRSADSSQTWVVFRGTGNMSEWKVDMDAQQVPWADAPGSPPVHAGFQHLYRSIESELQRALVGAPSTLYITGHSLGAGLAILCASYLARQMPGRGMQVYAFAPPAVGGAAFVKLVQSMSSVLLLPIANATDIVPTLPMAVHPNFSDPMHPWLYRQFPLWTFYANWGSWERNHRLNVYKAHAHGVTSPTT